MSTVKLSSRLTTKGAPARRSKQVKKLDRKQQVKCTSKYNQASGESKTSTPSSHKTDESDQFAAIDNILGGYFNGEGQMKSLLNFTLLSWSDLDNLHCSSP
eukprot:CAMPEP_0117741754 /NCGR_PEP_ID=MMETSP0947-20121206/5115_1 /TAXON_ID=44440 /ORGANISM="Chattonella subsalsa, Strain CCMP2191" /LENGTH=100 /DNA_ID=CAMNT_0005558099 /DNA_START=21 /DNA_END=323 /DNA_ORIENTATION=-